MQKVVNSALKLIIFIFGVVFLFATADEHGFTNFIIPFVACRDRLQPLNIYNIYFSPYSDIHVVLDI